MNAVRIVDLDSTVSDDRWRQWLIDEAQPDTTEKYHAYHVHCDKDKVINRHIVDDSPVPVIFLTARPEYLRGKTERWLKENSLDCIALMMRPNDDHTPSPVLKESALYQIERLFKVEKAYDDRPDVVAMFRFNGVEAVLV